MINKAKNIKILPLQETEPNKGNFQRLESFHKQEPGNMKLKAIHSLVLQFDHTIKKMSTAFKIRSGIHAKLVVKACSML